MPYDMAAARGVTDMKSALIVGAGSGEPLDCWPPPRRATPWVSDIEESTMRVALAQMTSGRDIGANLVRCRELAALAHEGGARWILYPENAPYLGDDIEKPSVAEGDTGPMVGAFRALAADFDLWVTLGSYPEAIPGSTKTYNTQLLIDPTGAITSKYRKIHMFDVELEGGVVLRESDGCVPGSEIVTATIPFDGEPTLVGLSTCYDLRFPELYREQVRCGAKVLIVPSAFTLQTGRDHWDALLRARAIENQCWVLAPAQYGHHHGKRWSYGHSVVYDPWGHLVACASDREQLLFAEVDLELVHAIRRRMPCLEHRRL